MCSWHSAVVYLFVFGHNIPFKRSSRSCCSKLGISKNSRICDLPDFKIKQIANHLDLSQLLISSNLKKIKSKASKKLISIKSVRGIRKLKGLPVRGQRTHTNAKNSKKRYIY